MAPLAGCRTHRLALSTALGWSGRRLGVLPCVWPAFDRQVLVLLEVGSLSLRRRSATHTPSSRPSARRTCAERAWSASWEARAASGCPPGALRAPSRPALPRPRAPRRPRCSGWCCSRGLPATGNKNARRGSRRAGALKGLSPVSDCEVELVNPGVGPATPLLRLVPSVP